MEIPIAYRNLGTDRVVFDLPNRSDMQHIQYRPEDRAIVVQLKSSFYLLRIDAEGRLHHMAFAPGIAPDRTPALDAYGIEPKCWDLELTSFEYPAAGDATCHEAAIRAVFTTPPPAMRAGEVFTGTIRDYRPRYASHEIVEDARPGFHAAHGQTASPGRSTLRITLHDACQPLEMVLCYRAAPDCDLIERWVELKNLGPSTIQIRRLDFACLPLPPHTTELISVSGAWGAEFGRTRQNLVQGIYSMEQGGLNTGHFHNPFFFLHRPNHATEESGNVWFGALAYSGNWSLRFETLPSGHVRAFGGYGSGDFDLTLAPGESHATPAMIVGCSPEGIGGASRRLHRFVRDQVLPKTDRTLRPVIFNSWEDTFFDVDESSQRELARVAADLGVELFCLDDGWFGARSSDLAGLGDWTPRLEAFPNGLKPLADEVRSLGMRFGLWVEPEMVNPDSRLYRQHPEWVLHYPGRPRTECRNQLVLDFGRPEVVECILGQLDNLVREIGINFFKWDMNRYATEPGSVAGAAIWREHVRGLYHIMDELRRRHPGLDIQSCSGGGGRVDLGVLSRCDQAWTSDNTDAVARTRIQDGYSLAYPPRTMECWVTHEENYLTRRHTSLDFRFDVAMRGALGIGSKLSGLTETEKKDYRRLIRFYKKIRPVVQTGDLYRLEQTHENDASVWLIVGADARSAVFSSLIFNTAVGRHHGPFVLQGLDPASTYKVTDSNGSVGTPLTGAQLMTLGLPGGRRNGEWAHHACGLTLFLEAI